jgi:hypothetical protein
MTDQAMERVPIHLMQYAATLLSWIMTIIREMPTGA